MDIISEYFTSLFTSSKPHHNDIEIVACFITRRIDDDKRRCLEGPFIAMDIRQVVFEMHPSKFPGPNGFSMRFFQKLWLAIGDYITKEELGVLNDNKEIGGWNKTLITLIPKKREVREMKDFRPISLCNTIYKVAAKALVIRLRPCLDDVIDQNQSAFIPRRQISDNIMMGYECLHWMQSLKKGKFHFAALKLDMSKAHDRVE